MPTKLRPLKLPEGKIPPETSPEAEIIEHEGEIWSFYDGLPVTTVGHRRALPKEYCHPEPNYSVGRCRMIKTTGDRCKNPVRSGWSVCRFHGAGLENRPGGSPPITGRHSKFLPTRFVEQFEAHISDPDYLNLNNEIALIDTRVSELLGMLDGADTKVAWAKIRGVAFKLSQMVAAPDSTTAEDFKKFIEVQKGELYNAIAIRSADHEIWSSIQEFVEQRRKLADTERRRILDARKYLTLTEANAMMAFISDAVLRNVKDPLERLAIVEQFKKLGGGNPTQLLAAEASQESTEPDEEDESNVIDMEMGGAENES